MLPRRDATGLRAGKAAREGAPSQKTCRLASSRTPRGREDSLKRRLLAVLVAAFVFVPAAGAVRVHVRVEGMTRTIFGPTAPVLDVKVNALDALDAKSPPVGADQVKLQDGDTVLWYWAQFGAAGGPKTLVLDRAGSQKNCYRVYTQDDNGVRAAALGAVLHFGTRTVVTQGATQAAVACVGPHRGLLVRATLAGAVRSNALT